MKIVLMTMPAAWEQDQHDFMNRRHPLFRWLKIRPLVNVVPSPSLLYLAPYLLKDGHQVSYLEGLFLSFEEVCKRLENEPEYKNPDLIGVTITSVDWENSRWKLEKLKQRFPAIKIVIGGIHPTLWLERCFEECSAVDYLVYGEGEYTMRELANNLEQGNSLEAVNGLIFRKNGKLIRTLPRNPVKDLDQLPFPAHNLVDLKDYLPSPTFYNRLPHASIIGARGCPYQCIFCHTERYTRMRSATNIVDEIELLVQQQGVVDVAFWDDTFTLSEKRAVQFCDEMIHRKLKVDWAVNARVDKINYKLLEKMKAAGCWRILYGIESGVQKNLDRLKKETNLEQIRDAIKMTNEVGIEAYGTFMFGIPGETYEEGLETIKFACSIGLDYAVFVNLTPFPGTEVYEDVKTGRIKPALFVEDRFNLKNVSFVPEGLTEEQVRYLIREGHRRFYLSPKMILRKIGRIKNFYDLKKYIKGFSLLATAQYDAM